MILHDFNIDLSGLPPSRWTETGSRCADCRRVFEEMREEDPDDGDYVPLILFRGEGKATQALYLCWPCATRRMSQSDVATGAE